MTSLLDQTSLPKSNPIHSFAFLSWLLILFYFYFGVGRIALIWFIPQWMLPLKANQKRTFSYQFANIVKWLKQRAISGYWQVKYFFSSGGAKEVFFKSVGNFLTESGGES